MMRTGLANFSSQRMRHKYANCATNMPTVPQGCQLGHQLGHL